MSWVVWARFDTWSQNEKRLTLSSQTTKPDPNGIMTILHAFQHHSSSHWRRTVWNYNHLAGSGTTSWCLIFTRDDRMRSVRLENKCESSYRSEGYTDGTQGDRRLLIQGEHKYIRVSINMYRVSINSFPDYKDLLQENYVEYKNKFFSKCNSTQKVFFYYTLVHFNMCSCLYST